MRLFTILKELIAADSSSPTEMVKDDADLYKADEYSAEDNYYGLDQDLNLDTNTD